MVRLEFWVSLVTGFVMMTSTPKLAESAEPIRYLLRIPAPHTHYVEVEARVPVRRILERRDDDGGLDAWIVPRA